MTAYAPPLNAALAGRPLAWKLGVVLAGGWLLAASSWIEAPMYPVPMTLQTFAVLLVAGLAGGRMASAIVLAWLAQAFAGLPLLAGGAGGPAPFVGPTAGYLAGFVVAAAACGWLTERPALRGWLPMTSIFLAGHAVILGLGFAWLSHLFDARAAWASGVLPFLAGSVLKSILAVAVIKLAEPWARRALRL
ncbi:MAG TPA: biotin transporter BioY [Phenylobacterium sp.]|nr:biotin transporter BioY [Phenylobacterium sp.]